MFKFRKTVVLATAGMSILLALAGCGAEKKTQINTTDGITNILDYVTVDFNGKNGEGTAFVNVDYDVMETEMVGGKEKIEELDELGDLTELTKYINAVSSISVSIDKNKELSNGDEVVVSVTYDETAAESAGVVFGDETSKSFEVKGLKK